MLRAAVPGPNRPLPLCSRPTPTGDACGPPPPGPHLSPPLRGRRRRVEPTGAVRLRRSPDRTRLPEGVSGQPEGRRDLGPARLSDAGRHPRPGRPRHLVDPGQPRRTDGRAGRGEGCAQHPLLHRRLRRDRRRRSAGAAGAHRGPRQGAEHPHRGSQLPGPLRARQRPHFAGGCAKESGPVAFWAQSGTNANTAIYDGQLRGLRFSKVVSFGNAVDVNAAELCRYALADPETEIVGAYIEGLPDARDLFQALRALAAAKPVALLKGGMTQAGARSTRSHTASLAGSAEIWRAAAAQANVVLVGSMQESIDMLVGWRYGAVPRGNRVALVVGGGGALGPGLRRHRRPGPHPARPQPGHRRGPARDHPRRWDQHPQPRRHAGALAGHGSRRHAGGRRGRRPPGRGHRPARSRLGRLDRPRLRPPAPGAAVQRTDGGHAPADRDRQARVVRHPHDARPLQRTAERRPHAAGRCGGLPDVRRHPPPPAPCSGSTPGARVARPASERRAGGPRGPAHVACAKGYSPPVRTGMGPARTDRGSSSARRAP